LAIGGTMKHIFLLFIGLSILNTDFTAPEIKGIIENDELTEISGIVMSRKNKGQFWVHNDSGGDAAVYAINSKGEHVTKVTLQSIQNRDWEDIAIWMDQDKYRIVIADIGDNDKKYSSINLYVFEEPNTLSNEKKLIPFSEIKVKKLVYKNGPRDAEAIFIKENNAYIITKNDTTAQLHKFDLMLSGRQTGKIIGNFNVIADEASLRNITSADFFSDNLILRNYESVFELSPFRNLQDINQSLKNLKSVDNYLRSLEPQGEAICFDIYSNGFYTVSEEIFGIESKLIYYKL